jgi:hypothetical protein
MMLGGLCFMLTCIGYAGKKFSGYTDSRCAEWLVNKSYWSGAFALFFLVATAYMTYGNMLMKHEIQAFTKSKEMGMKPTFEPYELNDYLGVPRDEDPH